MFHVFLTDVCFILFFCLLPFSLHSSPPSFPSPLPPPSPPPPSTRFSSFFSFCSTLPSPSYFAFDMTCEVGWALNTRRYFSTFFPSDACFRIHVGWGICRTPLTPSSDTSRVFTAIRLQRLRCWVKKCCSKSNLLFPTSCNNTALCSLGYGREDFAFPAISSSFLLLSQRRVVCL